MSFVCKLSKDEIDMRVYIYLDDLNATGWEMNLLIIFLQFKEACKRKIGRKVSHLI